MNSADLRPVAANVCVIKTGRAIHSFVISNLNESVNCFRKDDCRRKTKNKHSFHGDTATARCGFVLIEKPFCPMIIHARTVTRVRPTTTRNARARRDTETYARFDARATIRTHTKQAHPLFTQRRLRCEYTRALSFALRLGVKHVTPLRVSVLDYAHIIRKHAVCQQICGTPAEKFQRNDGAGFNFLRMA